MSQPNSLPKGVTPKYLPDGKENPNYADLLEEDKPIAGQKFVCLSFVSPEHIIKQKEQFLFEQFVKQWDYKKSMEKFTQFLNFVSFKYSLSFDKLTADFQEFTKEEGETIRATSGTLISDDYKTFLDNNEDELEQVMEKAAAKPKAKVKVEAEEEAPAPKKAAKVVATVDEGHHLDDGHTDRTVGFYFTSFLKKKY